MGFVIRPGVCHFVRCPLSLSLSSWSLSLSLSLLLSSSSLLGLGWSDRVWEGVCVRELPCAFVT